LPAGLVPASDRYRFRAVEHLAGVDARGGTELLAPMREALALLAGSEEAADRPRDRVLVLVTDGQVGNEDQILRETTGALAGIRVHTVGIDQAVNAGFLGRLASVGGGRCELVETEDRLDEAMDAIHRRIGAPLVTGLRVGPAGEDGPALLGDSATPSRTPDLFPGVPLVVRGRYRGAAAGALAVTGTRRDGEPWRVTVPAQVTDAPAVRASWARSRLRDLEDRYAVSAGTDLERAIVATSLRFGVLCRFTAYLAVDPRKVTDGGPGHRVIQPVEQPAGWEPAGPASYGAVLGGAPAAAQPMVKRAKVAGGAAVPLAYRPAQAPAGPPPDLLDTRSVKTVKTMAARSPLPVVVGAELRDQLAAEVARLRAATGEPAWVRQELLDDLAGRLDALARDRTVPAELTGRLSELVRDLRDGSRPLAERWDGALAVLDELAAPAEQQGQQQGEAARRVPFWKS
jgi:Ca-activated chloride channel family protein